MKFICLFWLFSLSILSSAEIVVKTEGQLEKAAKTAASGDVIKLGSGAWKNVEAELKFKQPGIVIDGDHAVFTGKSSLEIRGNDIVLRGITFRDGFLDGGHVIRIRGENCRVTQCEIANYNPKSQKTRYHWLSLHGYHHRVDHCSFTGQNHSGCTLVVWLDEEKSGNHIIDHNFFGYRKRGDANGFETIRIGTSEYSMKSANCLVMKNLFRECDGEIELISNKSCGNTYLANTIENCAGCLTLRHGNDCLVSHNIIDGGNKKGTGGIRVVGSGHRIIGNVILQTRGRGDGAIGLSASVPNAKLHEHAQVTDILIAGNQFQRNEGKAISFTQGLGHNGRKLLPQDISIARNQFIDLAESEVKTKPGKDIASWKDNRFQVRTFSTPLPYHLTKRDVGPKATPGQNPGAIPNSHSFGEIDTFENAAYIIPNPRSAGEYIMDDSEAILEGDWQYSTHTPPHVGYGYLHDRKENKGKKSVTYQIDVPSGRYHVEMSHCTNVRRSTNTPVTIFHADGTDTKRVDQQEIPKGPHRLFRKLGTFRFEEGKPARIRISTEGTDGKYVIADAIRLVPVEG